MRAAAVAPEQQQSVHQGGDDHHSRLLLLLLLREVCAVDPGLCELQFAAVAVGPVGVEVEDGREDAPVLVGVVAVAAEAGA
jgi:hypothetical protein